jgi:hypothetical protein
MGISRLRGIQGSTEDGEVAASHAEAGARVDGEVDAVDGADVTGQSGYDSH